MGERRRPGPKAEIPNPHPAGDPTPITAVWMGLLADDYQGLRDYFKKRREELRRRPNEGIGQAEQRIRRLAEQALNETGVGWWSNLRKKIVIPPDPSDRRSGIPKGSVTVDLYGHFIPGADRHHVEGLANAIETAGTEPDATLPQPPPRSKQTDSV